MEVRPKSSMHRASRQSCWWDKLGMDTIHVSSAFYVTSSLVGQVIFQHTYLAIDIAVFNLVISTQL